jgi:hypothetical protein
MSFYTPIPTLAPDEQQGPPLGPRVWAGAILMASSVLFLLLGGCFAVGILILLDPTGVNGGQTTPPDLSPDQQIFLLALYVLAAMSVLASGMLFFIGILGLVRILYGKTGHS